jgi:hypothetical protein
MRRLAGLKLQSGGRIELINLRLFHIPEAGYEAEAKVVRINLGAGRPGTGKQNTRRNGPQLTSH